MSVWWWLLLILVVYFALWVWMEPDYWRECPLWHEPKDKP
jgi:hypothetical protein